MVDDERLLEELGKAVRAAKAVPDRAVQAGKAALAWRTVDADLAELTHDSATRPAGALAGARADPAVLRALTFVADDITIEIELTASALQGQVVPSRPGQIELQQPDGATNTAPIDDVGWFIFTPCPAGTVRLRLRGADTTVTVTEWLTV